MPEPQATAVHRLFSADDKGRGAEPGHPGTKAEPGHPATTKTTQADLYEVPKKHH